MSKDIDNDLVRLKTWSSLNKENAEFGFTDALFRGALSASSVIDSFSAWLIAGTGATAALMIANVDKLAPVIGGLPFKLSIHVLVISALLGFAAKFKAISCQIAIKTREELEKSLIPILDKHSEDEDKIKEQARKHGIEISTKIDTNIVIAEYNKAFPAWLRKVNTQKFSTGISERLKNSRNSVNCLIWQSFYSLLQCFSFLAFVLIAVSNVNIA